MSIKRVNYLRKSTEEHGGFKKSNALMAWDYGCILNLPLWIDFIKCETIQKNAFFHHSRQFNFAVEFVLDGELTIIIENETFTIKSGEFIITPTVRYNRLECNTTHCTKIGFGICGCRAESNLEAMGIPVATVCKLTDPQKLEVLLGEFYKMYKSQDAELISEIYPFIHKILFELKLQIAIPLKNPLLVKAVRLINGIYTSNLKIESIADELSVSYNLLYKLFKDELHISPKKYLSKLRIDKAKNMLKTTDYSVKEIAFACGYQSYQVFNNEFKKHFNQTPIAFKKANI